VKNGLEMNEEFAVDLNVIKSKMKREGVLCIRENILPRK
jgi:hypothetical protein